MRRAANIAVIFALGLFVLVVANSSLYGQAPAAGAGNGLPAGDGRDFVAVACSQCHGLKTIMALRDGPVGWKILVDDMILRGAQLTPQEAATAIQYPLEEFRPGCRSDAGWQGRKGSLRQAGRGKSWRRRTARCATICRESRDPRGAGRSGASPAAGMMAKVSGMATSERDRTMTAYSRGAIRQERNSNSARHSAERSLPRAASRRIGAARKIEKSQNHHP